MDIYGIVGWPVKHSLSPAMHNTAFKALGIDAKYEKFEVKPEDLEDFLLNRKDVAGFNVTIPHKVKAKQILEKKGASDPGFVNLCGAINTVRRDNDKLYYTNTDVPGFLTSLKEDLKFDPKDKNILLIGCGGAGRAVMAGLQESSSEIYAYDESEKAMESCKGFNKVKFISKQKIDRIIKGCHLLVNATPIGMKEGDSCPIDKNLLHKDLFVYDVVYNRETELVRAAEAPAVNGLGMLLYQGAHAFEFWTGKKAPVDVMREELKKAIKWHI